MKLGEVCMHGSLKRKCETCEIAEECDALLVKIEKLKTDNEEMLWNLGACSTFAMGFCLDEPHAISRSAPNDVLKLALEHRALRKRVEELERTVKLYKTALEANQEVIQALQGKNWRSTVKKVMDKEGESL